MTQYIVDDIMMGTMLTFIVASVTVLSLIAGLVLYQIHPIVPVAFMLLWVTIVGYLVQTNHHNDVDVLWWYR